MEPHQEKKVRRRRTTRRRGRSHPKGNSRKNLKGTQDHGPPVKKLRGSGDQSDRHTQKGGRPQKKRPKRFLEQGKILNERAR